MTSKRYYINWWKEAGRGHFTAVLSWGSYLFYFGIMLFRLRADTEYTFFGIGNGQELFLLTAGLGLAIGFIEFFYLFQKNRQDFYYSLPVKTSTVFWSHYLHGLLHGFLPLMLYLLFCGVYQGSMDAGFLTHSVGYTMRSIVMFGLVYLIFYQIAVLSAAICGNMLSSLFIAGAVLLYVQILIRGVWIVSAENLYQTFYRIPLAERMQTFFVSWKLGEELVGGTLFEKNTVLEYMPAAKILFAAVLWNIVLFAAIAFARKQRTAEAVGRLWVTCTTERIVEILISILTGLGAGVVALCLFDITAEGIAITAVILAVIGAAAAALAHIIIEKLIQMSKADIFRRKKQMFFEIAVICGIVISFAAAGNSYDAFLPEKETVAGVGLCIDGLDMKEHTGQIDSWLTDAQLEKFTLTGDGMEAAMDWIYHLRGEKNSRIKEESPFTDVTVCYHMKNGALKYRTYPVSEEALHSFASVYESSEYKAAAYPVPEKKEIRDKQFAWNDGVTEKAFLLSDADKEAFREAYLKDVAQMKMLQMTEQLPNGFVETASRTDGKKEHLIVYPFFENAFRFLTAHEIDVGKTLFDYEIRSIQIMRYRSGRRLNGTDYSGGVTMEMCNKQEEISAWRDRLIPNKLNVQPLLYPLDTAIAAKAEIEDPQYRVPVDVKCTGR